MPCQPLELHGGWRVTAPTDGSSRPKSAAFSVNPSRCPHARARPAPIPARSEADRPAPAGWAALRLLADVDISFSRNCSWQLRGRTMELGRSAPMLMMTSASPGRAAAMVPAPVERSELPGHRQRSPNSALNERSRNRRLSHHALRFVLQSSVASTISKEPVTSPNGFRWPPLNSRTRPLPVSSNASARFSSIMSKYYLRNRSSRRRATPVT